MVSTDLGTSGCAEQSCFLLAAELPFQAVKHVEVALGVTARLLLFAAIQPGKLLRKASFLQLFSQTF